MIRQTVLFGGFDASGAAGLWATNGTAAGTYELTGTSSSFPPSDFTVFNGNEVFYSTSDLWVTNGTAAGTSELTVNGADSMGLHPSNLTVEFFGFNTLFFTGFDSSGGLGLWASNGTAAGTTEVGGIDDRGVSGAYATGLWPESLTVFRPKGAFSPELLFSGLGASGGNLWVTDGSAADTIELTGVSGANITYGLEPSYLVTFGVGEVLFNGYDSGGARGLWITNGTVSGTSEVTSGAPSHGLNPMDMTAFNGEFIFDGTNAFGVQGLWLTNGTAAGTQEIVGYGGAPAGGIFSSSGSPPDFIVYNGNVLFQGMDASGNLGLWVTNGTTAGTVELTGIAGAYSSGIFGAEIQPYYPGFTSFNGEVLFGGADASGNYGLWVTDGTAAGTHELTGISTANPIGMTAVTFTIPPPEDFNGNNTSDVLFRNTTSGDTWFEAMNHGAFNGWHQIGGSNTSYGVAGTGDFYGTGGSDILFRNNSTGDTWFEAISNGSFAGWHQIGGSNTSYGVAGTGDFYGTGGSDILFRNNSTGDTWFEAISNGASAGWHQIGGSDTHYSVVGVGDFFGNGTDDILFRNNSTGDTWFEAISNGAFAGWNQIGGSDTTYSVVGIGDYFGSNTSDILFRNSAGDTWVEQITNGAFAGWSHIGGSNTSYSVPITVGPPALT
jgi:ELWxxDGT repeat protein